MALAARPRGHGFSRTWGGSTRAHAPPGSRAAARGFPREQNSLTLAGRRTFVDPDLGSNAHTEILITLRQILWLVASRAPDPGSQTPVKGRGMQLVHWESRGHIREFAARPSSTVASCMSGALAGSAYLHRHLGTFKYDPEDTGRNLKYTSQVPIHARHSTFGWDRHNLS